MVKAGQLAVHLWRWTGPKDIGEEFARKFRESEGKMPMKMVKRQLVLGPSVTPVKEKLLAAGELGDGRHVYIHRDLTPEEVKALSAGGVQVLDWYVADGVLPEPAH
jgi:hypothetical protein